MFSQRIFMNTLKYLQTHEYLLDVDLWRLFANLEELSQTSFDFVNSVFGIIKDYAEPSETSLLMDFISMLTKAKSFWDIPVSCSLCQSHQTYCLNDLVTVFYLESLRQRDDLGIYLKGNTELHLPELLVTPLDRWGDSNIWKWSRDTMEKIMIYSIKEKMERSIRILEGKVKWLDNCQKCRHLRKIIVWPPLWDRNKKLHSREHMAENILSPTTRQLFYEGKLTLAESTRFLGVYMFLFDDFLLVVKTNCNKKVKCLIKEGGSCMVLDQPIPLDRLVVKSIDPLHMSAFGLRNAFLVRHENRYRRCKTWMTQITAAISCFTKNQETKKITLRFTLGEESGAGLDPMTLGS
uniref:Uncharacterized protein n=1 Tax=Panthera tigris altaica TaxID=74533 RepID=A0A8C9K1Q1_PANTA